MLAARKSVIFERIFSFYNQNLLKRRFHDVRVSGLEFLLNRNTSLPLIIYCNHSSWWDGLVAFQISRKIGLNSFVLMDEKNLKRLFLFRGLGAFSIDRSTPRAALKSIQYAAKILSKNSGAALWIFPQGEILPNDQRPLKFFSGISRIVRLTRNCETTSLAMRYEFLGEFKPQIFIKIEKSIQCAEFEATDKRALTETFTGRMTENLDALKNKIIEQEFDDFVSLLN